MTLPRDKKVLVYAMTASNNPIDDVKLASRTFVRPDERKRDSLHRLYFQHFIVKRPFPSAGRPFSRRRETLRIRNRGPVKIIARDYCEIRELIPNFATPLRAGNVRVLTI